MDYNKAASYLKSILLLIQVVTTYEVTHGDIYSILNKVGKFIPTSIYNGPLLYKFNNDIEFVLSELETKQIKDYIEKLYKYIEPAVFDCYYENRHYLLTTAFITDSIYTVNISETFKPDIVNLFIENIYSYGDVLGINDVEYYVIKMSYIIFNLFNVIDIKQRNKLHHGYTALCYCYTHWGHPLIAQTISQLSWNTLNAIDIIYMKYIVTHEFDLELKDEIKDFISEEYEILFKYVKQIV